MLVQSKIMVKIIVMQNKNQDIGICGFPGDSKSKILHLYKDLEDN